LWGGNIKAFHPPVGKFDGVIGGPPCQAFSRLVHIIRAKGQTPAPNLIPEFERVVNEAAPEWFLMENVPAAPEPWPNGYNTSSRFLNNRAFGQEQNRQRRFTFGSKNVPHPWRWLEFAALEAMDYERAVVAQSSKEGALAKSQEELRDGTSRRMQRRASVLPGQMPRRTVARCAELQGLPADFLADAPFTAAGKYEAIGNGVPIPMGRAIAKAVRMALAQDRREARRGT